jgi:Adenylate and Guanylate cyclase catalytic domain
LPALKVETVGESYMISCGVPYPTPHHAEYIADTSLDLLAVLSDYVDSSSGKRVLIKMGKSPYIFTHSPWGSRKFCEG